MSDIFNMADTWNNGATTFSAIKMNVTDTASNSASLLLDLQLASANRLSLRKDGYMRIDGGAASIQLSTTTFLGVAGPGIIQAASNSGSYRLGASSDVILAWDAANTLALRNGTNLQTFVLYQTYTDPSNYRGLEFGNNGTGNHRIRAISAGTGGTNSNIQISTNTNIQLDCTGVFQLRNAGGGLFWERTVAGHFIPGATNTYDMGASATGIRNLYMASWLRMATTTVASLPAAATAAAGARMFVTDALTPVFGNAVAGGGAVTVPVYSTGSAWNVG